MVLIKPSLLLQRLFLHSPAQLQELPLPVWVLHRHIVSPMWQELLITGLSLPDRLQTGGGTTNSVTVTVGANNGTITVTPSNGCGNGTDQTLAVTTTTIPAQPSAITGATSPCVGSSQTYSVTNVAGVTYNWAFPAGWT